MSQAILVSPVKPLVGSDSNVIPFSGDISASDTRTFSRTWQWHIDSNSEAPGYNDTSKTIDEGWHILPWRYLTASITPPDWQAALINSTAFAVLEMGFEIGRVIMTKEEVLVRQSATTIRSDFASEPRMLLLRDHGNDFDLSLRRVATDDRKFWMVSDGLTQQWARNKSDSTLVRVCWKLPTDYNTEGKYAEEVLTPSNVFCSLNSDHFRMGHTMGETDCWHNPSPHWYGITELRTEDGWMQPNLRTISDFNKLGEYGYTEFNTDTLVNHHYSHLPPVVLLKLLPLFSPDHPIQTSACIFVKCWSKLAFRHRSRIWLNLGQSAQSATKTGPRTRCVAPVHAFGNPRDRYAMGHKFNYQQEKEEEVGTNWVMKHVSFGTLYRTIQRCVRALGTLRFQ